MTQKQPKIMLKPNDMIGIIGGGQLGRMLAIKAAQLGLRTHIYCPDARAPAYDVASAVTKAAYDDGAAFQQFAQDLDVITYEFENIPTEMVRRLNALCPVYPSVMALEKTQDRLIEKEFLTGMGIPVAPFIKIDTAQDLREAADIIGLPLIFKTRRFGYDGKGQQRIQSLEQGLKALDHFGDTPLIAEAVINFQEEVSQIGVFPRTHPKSIAPPHFYALTSNHHDQGILAQSTAPAQCSDLLKHKAQDITKIIAAALDYCGVLAVEFFIDADDRLIVNEIAPRVHNSGHWTMDGCQHCQFENHIRAIAGWPIGHCEQHSKAVMTNLIGDQCQNWQVHSARDDVNLHLYGKKQILPGRKMGHITQLSPLDP